MWKSLIRRLLRHIKLEAIAALADFLDDEFGDQTTPPEDPTKVAPIKPKE